LPNNGYIKGSVLLLKPCSYTELCFKQEMLVEFSCVLFV